MQDQTSPTPAKPKAPEGIEVRHSKTCPSLGGGRCRCQVSYRAWVFDKRAKAKIRRTFPTLAAAKKWRADQTSRRDKGHRISGGRETLREVAKLWVEAGRTRSGGEYKPSTFRDYLSDLERYVLPEFGAHRIGDIRRSDLQSWVDELADRGVSGSKCRNIVNVVRAIYRYAIRRDLVDANPTVMLEFRAGSKPRDRAASVLEARRLLEALELPERALYATAMYGGLRRGELRGLRWDHVRFETTVDEDGKLVEPGIFVECAWDEVAGEIAPKSGAGYRWVPLHRRLREPLEELQKATGRAGRDFVFGPKADRPFTPSYIRKRAARSWAAANEKRAEEQLKPLKPIGLHECRHSFSSFLNAVEGIPETRQDRYMGHSDGSVQKDYRHQIEGQLPADADRLDKWFDAEEKKARRHLKAVAA
jgi:integrase